MPSPIRAMPATRATGMAIPVSVLAEQQPPDQRRDNNHRQSRSEFGGGGESEDILHRGRYSAPGDSLGNGRSYRGVFVGLAIPV